MSNNLTLQIRAHESALEQYIPQFEKVLPDGVKAQRIVRSVINALSTNNKLAQASRISVLRAAMSAAVLGLEVDNVMGQGYIVPFRGEAQFIPGYKGYITLARNNGFLLSGEAVRHGDHFAYKLGLNPTLEHSPAPGSHADRGPINYCYAMARHNTMPDLFKVMHVDEINKIRNESANYKYKRERSVWGLHYQAMAIKTVIRSLGATLPLNVQRAAAMESTFERTGQTTYIDGEDMTVKTSAGDIIEHDQTHDQPDLTADLGLETGNVESH